MYLLFRLAENLALVKAEIDVLRVGYWSTLAEIYKSGDVHKATQTTIFYDILGNRFSKLQIDVVIDKELKIPFDPPESDFSFAI